MKKFTKSLDMLRRALKVTPVGSQTYSKSASYLSGPHTPYFMDHGRGSHVWDIDGNEYIDFILGLGPVTVGYDNPEVNEAISRQLKKGITFSQATSLEVELAEKLVDIIPCAEMVRFVKNGGDATTAAVRLSRAYTGRDMVAVCGYHGMHDWYIGSTVLNRGVPKSVQNLTKTFDYNDISSLEKLFGKYPGKFAAVILEPTQGDPPKDNFLGKVKSLCRKNGAVLIFDEVVSGFRVALGGAQEYYKVTPDLAAIGKGMGNGLPISAVAGKKDILKLIEDGIFISTTFGGEALSLAGSMKTIEILERPGSFPHIWKVSSKLADGSMNLVKSKGLGDIISMFGLPPHSGLIFKSAGKLASLDLLAVYQQKLLMSGILTVGINNFCLATTMKDVDMHLDAVDQALDDIRVAIERDSIRGIVEGKRITPIFKRN
ncbi:MAG TPA: aspartate aminotransferase family protein [Lentisphaeria bacterium]|nr:aspartate aminotransferase family protein [Lentisphaeria bacterium]